MPKHLLLWIHYNKEKFPTYNPRLFIRAVNAIVSETNNFNLFGISNGYR